jgi:DNA-binding NarL/FixJ family response regulator
LKLDASRVVVVEFGHPSLRLCGAEPASSTVLVMFGSTLDCQARAARSSTRIAVKQHFPRAEHDHTLLLLIALVYAFERMDDRRPLTQRQREILVLYARGMKRPEIVRELDITADTVRSHLQQIRAKLGTNSTTVAIIIALARDELQLDGEVVTARSLDDRVLQAA